MCSLLGNSKLDFLLKELSETKDISGDLAEVGVYKGGTALKMAQDMPDKAIHLFDTFKGIVGAVEGLDVHGNGDFGDCSLDIVKNLMSSSKAIFHVGMFPETFKGSENLKFSFVHSDTDTYLGATETLKIFVPRVAPGGKILFDDWKWRGCPGVEKAVTEFIARNMRKISCGAIRIKEQGNQIVLTFM